MKWISAETYLNRVSEMEMEYEYKKLVGLGPKSKILDKMTEKPVEKEEEYYEMGEDGYCKVNPTPKRSNAKTIVVRKRGKVICRIKTLIGAEEWAKVNKICSTIQVRNGLKDGTLTTPTNTYPKGDGYEFSYEEESK